MTDKQFKSHLRDLLKIALLSRSIDEVIKHLKELLRDYQ